jgi:hypothetical protein
LPPRARRRLLIRAAAAVLLLSGVAVPTLTAAPAAATTAAAQRFVQGINAARRVHGLPPLAVARDLGRVAAGWAATMAAAGDIGHDPQLRTAVTGWRALGENVGKGPDVASIAAAFLTSAPHRANILDRGYTEVGVGTAVDAAGMLYVVEDFREPVAKPAQPGDLTGGAGQPAARVRHTALMPASNAARRPAPPLARGTSLLDRLTAVQAGAPAAADPVARAIRFARTMATLTG